VPRWRPGASFLLVLSITLLATAVLGACAGTGPGQSAPPERSPAVRRAELWFATTPAPGVWADLLLVLENPLAEPAERTVLRFPATLLEDFALRDTEPPLLGPPVREADGGYAFVFPPPLDRSLNWYRVYLAARRQGPRPFQVAVSIDRPAGAGPLALSPTAPRARYVDRAADPFRTVPEALVAWLPSRPAALLPLLVLTGAVLATTVTAGCLAAFWLQKR
jgi:hypothetical protein